VWSGHRCACGIFDRSVCIVTDSTGGPAFELATPPRPWVPRPCVFGKGGNSEGVQQAFLR
jgi:hypothetical protein